ncbi:unnamed protein product [Dovyalis caffra]|uniref:Uncharacterized protein n=1 Tax=Dovyalis caffra TaxID=77055 RepID=A0AAV1RTV4_9ROSI|nr:unnamed protein product [Dovyalis caffra]
MKGSEISSSTPTAMIKTSNNDGIKPQKPQFRPAQDDTKPPLKDPTLLVHRIVSSGRWDD